MALKIRWVRLKNLFGIKGEYEFQAGQLVEISGDNGTGKTSLLEGIKTILGGGSIANVAYVDSDGKALEAEAALVLDDESREGAYRLEVDEKGTTVKERIGDTQGTKKMRQPRTFVSGLYDARASNPMKFIEAHPRERTNMLLEVLPIDLHRDQLIDIVTEEWWPVVEEKLKEAGDHALEMISAARQALYDHRTGVNVSQKDKERHAQEIRMKLPHKMPTEVDASKLEQEQAELAERVGAAKTKASADYQMAVQETQAGASASRAAAAAELRDAESAARILLSDTEKKLQANFDEKVRALKEQLEKDLSAARSVFDGAVKEKRGSEALRVEEILAIEREQLAAAEKARADALKAIEPDQARLDGILQEMADVRAQRDRAVELKAIKEMADRAEAEAKEFTGKAERLTAALEALESLKAKLVEGCGIDGLEVRGKAIFIRTPEGSVIPLEKANTAAQTRFATKVAIMRAQSQLLKAVFIDGAEELGPDNYRLMLEELEKAGVQVFIARVAPGPRQVTVK